MFQELFLGARTHAKHKGRRTSDPNPTGSFCPGAARPTTNPFTAQGPWLGTANASQLHDVADGTGDPRQRRRPELQQSYAQPNLKLLKPNCSERKELKYAQGSCRTKGLKALGLRGRLSDWWNGCTLHAPCWEPNKAQLIRVL